MDFFGSTVCCCAFRSRLEQNKQKTPWFLALACCCLMQFGGTTLVGLLLGQPASWTTSPTACRSLLLAFWLTVSCPLDLFYRMYQHKIIKSFIAIGAALSTGPRRDVVGRRQGYKRDPPEAPFFGLSVR